MKILPLFCSAVLVASAITSLTLSAAVYTWTDENGKVHYSDQPIGTETEATIQPSENNIADPISMHPQWQQDYNKHEKAKKEQAKIDAVQAKELKGYCDALKSELAVLNQGGRHYTMTPEGERLYENNDQIAAKKKKTLSAIKKDCK